MHPVECASVIELTERDDLFEYRFQCPMIPFSREPTNSGHDYAEIEGAGKMGEWQSVFDAGWATG